MGPHTDVEFVYGTERTPDGVLHQEIQARNTTSCPSPGGRLARNPLLWVATENNMVSDTGPADAVRFGLAPEFVSLENVAREVVMDKSPWTYALMAAELRREGRIDPAGKPGSAKIPDPRRFAYLEACGDLVNATLAFDIGVSRAGGQTEWFPSDRGEYRFRIARSGCFRAAVPLADGVTAEQITGVRMRAYTRPRRDIEPILPAGTGLVKLRRLNGVFMLDEDYRPGAVACAGKASLAARGESRAGRCFRPTPIRNADAGTASPPGRFIIGGCVSVYLLAIDHRWQWEDWCDANSVDRSRILPSRNSPPRRSSRAAAARRRADIRALLVDLSYGKHAVRDGPSGGGGRRNTRGAGGRLPSRMDGCLRDRIAGRLRQSPGAAPLGSRRRHRRQAARGAPRPASAVCRAAQDVRARGAGSRQWPAGGRLRQGRPSEAAGGYIRDAYASAWRRITGRSRACTRMRCRSSTRHPPRPGTAQLILGKGAGYGRGPHLVQRRGRCAHRRRICYRTARLYFEAAAAWLRGELSRDAARARIGATYEAVMLAWEARARAHHQAP